jgi:hypothetical protein
MIYNSHIVWKGQNFLQERDPFVRPVFQGSKVNPKRLVGDSDFSASRSTLQSMDEMLCFRRSRLSLRCPVTHKQGAVMHIPGPPTSIMTYYLINHA